MSLNLRLARPNDEHFLFELYADTRKEELDAWGWHGEQRQTFLEQQFAARQQSYSVQFPTADHRIILDAGQPIGRMLVHRTEDEFRLVDIALLSEHRNTGIGAHLIRELLLEAGKANKPARLQVLKGNPAVRLYERLGFVLVGDDGLYLQMELPLRSSCED
ncbi:MAG: GNAT family N-acetyltransferase [Planctomycetota bacterium]|jgi:ribosomal protein S18 acetylase RimI-like enzyme